VKNILLAGEGDGLAGFTGACRAADAVNVVLGVLGNIVIDHVADVLHVDAARGHVGGHQDFELSALEMLHQFETLALGQVPGDAFGGKPLAFSRCVSRSTAISC